MEEREFGKKRKLPKRSSDEERTGLKKETKLSSITMLNCPSKVTRSASKESSGHREKAKGGLPDGAPAFFHKLG